MPTFFKALVVALLAAPLTLLMLFLLTALSGMEFSIDDSWQLAVLSIPFAGIIYYIYGSTKE